MEDKSQIELSQDYVITIQHISTFRKQNNKGEKESESLPNYFLGIIWKKQGVLSVIGRF